MWGVRSISWWDRGAGSPSPVEVGEKTSCPAARNSGRIFFQAHSADHAPCARTIVAMRSPSLLADRARQCYYELLAMTSKSTIALGDALVGFRGRIRALAVNMAGIGLPGPALRRRPLQLGVLQGAHVRLPPP